MNLFCSADGDGYPAADGAKPRIVFPAPRFHEPDFRWAIQEASADCDLEIRRAVEEAPRHELLAWWATHAVAPGLWPGSDAFDRMVEALVDSLTADRIVEPSPRRLPPVQDDLVRLAALDKLTNFHRH